MAIIDKSKTVANLSSKLALPRDHYVLRCISEKFAPSKAGNPMITREWELVFPETKEIGGQTVNVAGTKFLQYLTVKVADGNGGWDAEKTAAAQGRLVADYDTLGFDSDNIDDENPALYAQGILADAICGSEESVQRKAQTPEQKAKKELGEEIKVDGKSVKSYRPVLSQLVGRATEEAIKPAGDKF